MANFSNFGKFIKNSNLMGKVEVKNVLSSNVYLILGSLFFLVIICFIAGVNSWLTIAVFILLCTQVFFFMKQHSYFSKTNPRLLLNEKTQVEMQKLDIGQKDSISTATIVNGTIIMPEIENLTSAEESNKDEK